MRRRMVRWTMVAWILSGNFVFAGCTMAQGEQRIDNVPMYGQPETSRPETLKKADEDFIKQASSAFGGNRKAASNAWIAQADEFMRKGNWDYAMRRYNQAWLLDPDSFKPYWGFARVADRRGNYDEAFRYFDKAKQRINDRYQEPALLADIGVVYHNKANSMKSDRQAADRYFAMAVQYYRESTSIDPTYVIAWDNWAYSLFVQGKYAEAWEKVRKIKSLDPKALSPKFLKELREKMPEP